MKLRKYQAGGPMPVEAAPEAAPMPAEAGAPAQAGPEEQIMGMAQEIISQLGPDGSAMLAEAIMQMLQAGAAEAAPAGEAPAGEPVFKKGGKICKRVKKACKGSKA